MRYTIIAAAAAITLAGLTTLAASPAQAQGFGVYVGGGPGWHGDDWRWRHRRHYSGAYAWGSGCRVVVRRHINRWGERVVVRRRICD